MKGSQTKVSNANTTSGSSRAEGAPPPGSVRVERRHSLAAETTPVAAARAGIYAGILIIVGSVLSGPVGLILVAIVHPTGSWQGASVLADHYHPIQTFPFFLGLVLVAGCDLLIAATYRLAADEDKTRALLAVMCAAAFTGLISFNYICQTTFIPALLTNYRPEYSAIVGTLSLVNPRSLSWAIEMWGWGLFGIATWLVAPVFHHSKLERATSWAFKLNGLMSVVGAIVTAADLTWVLTVPGMINFALWNGLMVVLAVLVIRSLSRRTSRGGSIGGRAGKSPFTLRLSPGDSP